MINQELNSLMYDHSIAKAKMNRGIGFLIGSFILQCVGWFFYGMGLYIYPLLILSIVVFLVCIPLNIFGLIHLISGIVGRAKANAAISRLKNSGIVM